jgi:hypothetical protein
VLVSHGASSYFGRAGDARRPVVMSHCGQG